MRARRRPKFDDAHERREPTHSSVVVLYVRPCCSPNEQRMVAVGRPRYLHLTMEQQLQQVVPYITGVLPLIGYAYSRYAASCRSLSITHR